MAHHDLALISSRTPNGAAQVLLPPVSLAKPAPVFNHLNAEPDRVKLRRQPAHLPTSALEQLDNRPNSLILPSCGNRHRTARHPRGPEQASAKNLLRSDSVSPTSGDRSRQGTDVGITRTCRPIRLESESRQMNRPPWRQELSGRLTLAYNSPQTLPEAHQPNCQDQYMFFRKIESCVKLFALTSFALCSSGAWAIPKAAEHENAPVTYGASDTPRPKPAAKTTTPPSPGKKAQTSVKANTSTAKAQANATPQKKKNQRSGS